METMYSVLGYRDNILIKEYKKKQFETLKTICKKTVSGDMWNTFETYSEGEQQKFLFHPDQASILFSLSFMNEGEKYKKIFEGEMQKFLHKNYKEMTMYSGIQIEGTSIYLSVLDNNPLNSQDAHPDGGGGIGWGDKSPAEWSEVYVNTLLLLKKIDEDFFIELNMMIQKIVPFGTAEHVLYSASYKECVGTLYMGYTLGTDIAELHVLEGMIHESSHNKLNLIMQYEDITLNDTSEKYYSPYRPDARHIYGVFLGIHALIPTVYILLKGVTKGYIQDRGWLEKIALYHVKNKLGIATMKKYGKLSAMGEQVFLDLIGVTQKSDNMVKDMLAKYQIPLAEVQKRAKEHFIEVNKNYPYLEY